MSLQLRLQDHLAPLEPEWREGADGWTASWDDEGRHVVLLVDGPLTGAHIVDARLRARTERARVTLAHGGRVTDVARKAAARFGIPLLDATMLPEPEPAVEPATVTIAPEPMTPSPAPANAFSSELPAEAPTPLALDPAPTLVSELPAPEPIVLAPEPATILVEPTPAVATELPAPAPVALLAEFAAVEAAIAPPAPVAPTPPLNVPTVLTFEQRMRTRFPVPDEGFFAALETAPPVPEPVALHHGLALPAPEPVLLLPAHVEPEADLAPAFALHAAAFAHGLTAAHESARLEAASDLLAAMEATLAEAQVAPPAPEPVDAAPLFALQDVAFAEGVAAAEESSALAFFASLDALEIVDAPAEPERVFATPAFELLADALDALEPAEIELEPVAPVAEPMHAVADFAPEDVLADAALEAELFGAAPELELPEDATPSWEVLAPAPAVAAPVSEPALPWAREPVAAEAPAAHVEADEVAAMPWNAPLYDAPGLAAPGPEEAPEAELLPTRRRAPTLDHPTLVPMKPDWGLPWPRPVAPTDGLSVADPALWAARERIQAVRDDLASRGGNSFGALPSEGSAWLKRIQGFGAP